MRGMPICTMLIFPFYFSFSFYIFQDIKDAIIYICKWWFQRRQYETIFIKMLPQAPKSLILKWACWVLSILLFIQCIFISDLFFNFWIVSLKDLIYQGKTTRAVSLIKGEFSLGSCRGQQRAANLEGPLVGDQANCAVHLDMVQFSF